MKIRGTFLKAPRVRAGSGQYLPVLAPLVGWVCVLPLPFKRQPFGSPGVNYLPLPTPPPGRGTPTTRLV
eukprot:761171-Hanusia_phi.AAC.1